MHHGKRKGGARSRGGKRDTDSEARKLHRGVLQSSPLAKPAAGQVLFSSSQSPESSLVSHLVIHSTYLADGVTVIDAVPSLAHQSPSPLSCLAQYHSAARRRKCRASEVFPRAGSPRFC